MWFSILGELRVLQDGVRLAVARGRDRTVLAMMLLRPNRVVTADDLVDAVWPDNPPRTARNQVYGSVCRLRRAFGPAGHAIDTEPPGYRLTVRDDELDLLAFERLLARGRAAAAGRRWREARDAWRDALAMFTAPALAGIDARVVRTAATALDERRWCCLEDCLDAELRLGLDRELVAELAWLVAEHPLRERPVAMYMLALSRCGRQAEALAAFRRLRAALADELGVEPDRHTAAVHRAILRGGPTLDRPA